jgi:hypothetical protein
MAAMLRARRVASIAVVAALGLVSLGGCRIGPDPAVAAYVGSVEITDARVTTIVDEYLAARGQGEGPDPTLLKNQMMQFLVLDEVVTDYAEANDIEIPRADAAAVAQEQQIPPDIELTKVVAEYSAALVGLTQAAPSVAPTEADQREAYTHATIDRQPVSEPFEEVQRFFDEQALGRSLGLRKLLNEALAAADVTVNPRYDATYKLPVQIQNASSWLAVELAGGAPVRDDPAGPVPQNAGDQGASNQG